MDKEKQIEYGIRVVEQEKQRIEQSTNNEAVKRVAEETAEKMIKEIKSK